MSALATTDFISMCPVLSIAMRMTWHWPGAGSRPWLTMRARRHRHLRRRRLLHRHLLRLRPPLRPRHRVPPLRLRRRRFRRRKPRRRSLRYSLSCRSPSRHKSRSRHRRRSRRPAVVGRLPHLRRSGSRRARTTPTVRLRGQQALLPCTKVNPAIGLSWIVTGMASPARSSKTPLTPAV